MNYQVFEFKMEITEKNGSNIFFGNNNTSSPPAKTHYFINKYIYY